MSRPHGALNKRTRAALSAAAEGQIAEEAERTIKYLLKITNDPKRDDATRLQAASVLLPYVKPRLASIEQHTIEDQAKKPEEELWATLSSLIAQNKEIAERLVAMALETYPEIKSKLLAKLAPAGTQNSEARTLQ